MEFTQEQKLIQELVQKSWENEGFKNELIKDPKATIEKLTGKTIKLPEGKTLVVKDQTDESVMYINISADQNVEDMELNEEQLEAVAGGLRKPFPSRPIDVQFDLIGDSAPPQDDLIIRWE